MKSFNKTLFALSFLVSTHYIFSAEASSPADLRAQLNNALDYNNTDSFTRTLSQLSAHTDTLGEFSILTPNDNFEEDLPGNTIGTLTEVLSSQASTDSSFNQMLEAVKEHDAQHTPRPIMQ